MTYNDVEDIITDKVESRTIDINIEQTDNNTVDLIDSIDPLNYGNQDEVSGKKTAFGLVGCWIGV